MVGAYPPGLDFWRFPECGTGTTRHLVEACDAVSFVSCSFEGRNGWGGGCDGYPGEHALVAVDSAVAVYGGRLIGGRGGDGFWCHGTYAGSGGDAVQATGAETRVLLRNVQLVGGAGGIDTDSGPNSGCDGEPTRTFDGAIASLSPPDSIFLDIAPLARPGTLASYTIAAPPGADLFLAVGLGRSWREFSTDEGILHLASPFRTFPLGTMGPTGTLTGSFPAPLLGGGAAVFAGIELQAYARVGGLERYSEPRTLHVTAVQ